MGGRCFLEVFVLCHFVRHHVFMETICHQPKASRIFWLFIVLFCCCFFVNIYLIIRNHIFVLYSYRYAFTPLIDDSEDEEIEEFIATSNFGTVGHQRDL